MTMFNRILYFLKKRYIQKKILSTLEEKVSLITLRENELYSVEKLPDFYIAFYSNGIVISYGKDFSYPYSNYSEAISLLKNLDIRLEIEAENSFVSLSKKLINV